MRKFANLYVTQRFSIEKLLGLAQVAKRLVQGIHVTKISITKRE